MSTPLVAGPYRSPAVPVYDRPYSADEIRAIRARLGVPTAPGWLILLVTYGGGALLALVLSQVDDPTARPFVLRLLVAKILVVMATAWACRRYE